MPQYYRFDQHHSLGLTFNDHLGEGLKSAWKDLTESSAELMNDEYFSHIFKRFKSEYLVTSADGEFVNMECTSWLDLSNEMELA